MSTRNSISQPARVKGEPLDQYEPFSPAGKPRAADRWCMDCDITGTHFDCQSCGNPTMHIVAKEAASREFLDRKFMGIALDELIVDLFAGGGGASLGIEWATGRSPDIGVNHNHGAISMHADNHPQTRHFRESVWDIDPRKVCRGQRVGLIHASPDCTHFSVAKGGTPVDKTIRGLANVVVRWAKYGARVITLENVKEFLTWGPLRVKMDTDRRPMRDENGDFLWEPIPERKGEYFRKWRRSIEAKGYKFGFEIMVAADYGSPTIRKRLFMCFRNDGLPIRIPRPTHGPGTSKPWRAASECIDFTDQGYSIFLAKAEAAEMKGPDGKRLKLKRPLADATMRRVARGVMKHVLGGKAFIVNLTHGGRVEDVSNPLNTITGANRGEKALVSPLIMGIDHASSDQVRSVEEGISTITEKARHALLSPVIVGVGSRAGQSGPRHPGEPLGTVIGKPDRAMAGCSLITNTTGHSATHPEDPAPTVTSGGQQMLAGVTLLKAFTTEHDNADVRDPLPSVTAKDHNQLAQAVFISQHNEGDRNRDVTEPLPTIVSGGKSDHPGGNAHGLGLIAASLVQQQGKSVGSSVESPLNAATGVNHHQLGVVSLIRTGNGERDGQAPRIEDIEKPLTTIVAQGQKQALSIVKLRGTAKDGDTIEKPLGAIAAQGQHEALSVVQLITYYGNGTEYPVSDPAATVTGTDRLALVNVTLDNDLAGAIRVARFLIEYGKPMPPKKGKKAVKPKVEVNPLDFVEWINVDGMDEKQPVVFLKQGNLTALLADILLRMLRPRELALCQGFGPDYILTGSGENQVARIGNSVCPQAAHAWVGAQLGTWPVEEEDPSIFGAFA